VEADGERLTYGELDEHANRLARRLQAIGVRPGDVVGVMAERGLHTAVAMVGAIKAGAAYAPLDPDSPKRRTHALVEQARCAAVITPDRLVDRLGDSATPLVALDRGFEALAGEHPSRLDLHIQPEDLFAVIFTSGSTGTPKAVALEHRNYLSLLDSAHELSPHPGEGALHVCAPQFDVAAYEIWATLLNGARLVCHAPGRPDPSAVCRTVIDHEVTWSMMATSIFHQLVENGPKDLCGMRIALVGGEVMAPRYARRFRAACPDTRLFNTYGPAETTVFVCVHEVGDEVHSDDPIPIGRAIPGAHLQILDDRREPVAPGEQGELYIAGPGVSRGYLHRPDLIGVRYLEDPSERRMYRSGDFVRERADGALEILGRMDNQVKVSGYRVSPTEIEANLLAHPGVGRAAVVAGADAPGHTRLLAYVAPSDGAIDEGTLREFLRERLPSYMVPHTISILDRLPEGPTGKVDRSALPESAPSGSLPAAQQPNGTVTATVAKVFTEVLGVPNVGPCDDFLELGGDSLRAVQLLARLRVRFDVDLAISSVFEQRTPSKLAGAIETTPSRAGQALPALLPRSGAGPTLASASQAKALLLSELAEESLPYQSQALHRILGALDVGALERSLTALVERHEILRTTFEREGGRWVQHVHEPHQARLVVEDLEGAPDPERALAEHFERVCHTRLDPARLPLARWSLARLAPNHHAFVILEHHVVHDGVSTAVFLRELAALYSADLCATPASLPPLDIQYRDFAVWQHALVDSDHGQGTLKYWGKRLAEAPHLELPTDKPRPARQTYRGRTLRATLPTPLAKALQERAREWATTPFSLMLAAYCTLLARYGSAEEIVVGSGLANRRTLASEGLIGMIVNTVALRVDLRGGPTPRALVERVQRVLMEAQDHQDVPFERVVEHLAPTRRGDAAPLYQTLFSFHDAPVSTLSLPGATLIPHDALANGSAKADLSVIVVNRKTERPVGVAPEIYDRVAEDGLTVVWEYNSDLYEPATAERMLEHFTLLLGQFAAGAEGRVGSLRLERGDVFEMRAAGRQSAYERTATIAEVFEARASENPHASALTFEGQAITYLQLNRRANRLAHRLRTLGVKRGSRVGVCMERSIEMVVSLLAVAKAGGAYVPLDPLDPMERLDGQLRALHVSLLLTLGRHRDRMPGPASRLMCVDDELDLSREPDMPPDSDAGPLDPAYVMFTSGSTGAPNAVEVPHRAIVRLVRDTDYVELGPDETLLAFAPAAFDASTFELWGALLNGARLVIAPPGPLTTGELAELVERERVSTMWLTAGLFQRVVDDRPETLRHLRQLLSGGDVLSHHHVRRALEVLEPGAVLVNGYGPTETTTFACAHRMRAGETVEGPIPIGRPIAGTRLYILDAAGEPVPVGVTGELYIGGDGVALGYANNMTLTNERFSPDPFSSLPGARMYRSGDLARWRPDGVVEFLGRADRQLKIRGFRVEPGEVEAALRTHPDVTDAAVVPIERAAGDRGLAAYVVAPGSDPPTAELRSHVARTLPSHAVPAAWARLDQLPLTDNGKIDVASLPDATMGVGRASTRDYGRSNRRAPDRLERKLMDIWKRALDLDVIDPDADFFELGGHSLLAVEVFDAIERSLGLRLPLATIFDAPTVRRLAASLRDEGWKSSRGSLVTLKATGSRPPLFFVSAGDGNSVGFGALARRLGEDQPFYALQPRGMNGGARLHATVETMASHYIREIRRVQRHGPYLLGGRCLGANVAYEMARRLEIRGEEVALLAVLDSGGPLWQPRLLADGTPFDEVMSSALRRSQAEPNLNDVFSAAGTDRLLGLLSEPVIAGSDGTTINRYLHEIYLMRADVRDIYPDLEGEDATWFVGWAWTSGREQLGLTEKLLPPAANPMWEAPAKTTGRERMASLKSRLAWRGAEAVDLVTRERRNGAAARRAARVRAAGLRAWHAYRAAPFGGEITLIRSEEFRVQPGLERWHGLDSGGVIEHHVRGTHRSMMREPDVMALAECVGELVDSATGRSPNV
jgi:amino acid adenylation domain-containing protein